MFVVRPLEVADIPRVMVVNRLCFPVPWSAWSIEQDVTHNRYSYWVVLERQWENPRENSLSRLWQWLAKAPKARGQIIGFGGFWIIHGEMHITNLGVDPAFRGQGWGEVLLAAMLKGAIELEAEYSTLEVRVSNDRAKKLYQKYDFQVVGHKRGYYHDNQEDAYDMATPLFDRPYYAMLEQHLQQLHQQLEWQDYFSEGAY